MALLFNTLTRFVMASKEQVSFNVMDAVTILSDIVAQENKICHCSHFSPFMANRREKSESSDRFCFLELQYH